MDIKFSFEGKDYVAGADFYDKDRVVLPDGTVLNVQNGWIETAPPQPSSLVRSEMPYSGTPEEIALRVNAAVACAV